MKIFKIGLISLLIFLHFQLNSQSKCNEIYRKALDIYYEGNTWLNDDKKAISKRIKKSRKKYREALDLFDNCTGDFSRIQKRKMPSHLMQLRFRLGDVAQIEEQFEKEFEKISPNWKNVNVFPKYNMAGLRKFILLHMIKQQSFYEDFRLNNGIVNDPLDNLDKLTLEKLLSESKILYKEFGSIYCLRFIEAKANVINGTSEETKHLWKELNELMAKCLLEFKSKKELLQEYSNSSIKEHDNRYSRNILFPIKRAKEMYFYTSIYKFNMFGVKFSIGGIYDSKLKSVNDVDLESILNDNYLINAIKNAP